MDPVLPVTLVGAVVSASDAAEPSILSLLTGADLVVQLVLLGLVGMSVVCWAIVIQKALLFRKAKEQSDQFLDLYYKSKRLDTAYEQVGRFPASPVAATFKAGYIELSRVANESGMEGLSENVERAMRRAWMVELGNLEKMIPFLATTGSTAPFVGLFGTVWGILRAFQRIGATGQATIATVGPDIAHALIATAVGLLAAIPAVMAYNFLVSRLKRMQSELDVFSSDFLNLVKRHYRGR